jgi:glycerophosphoryl diester phosphodiesterase
MSITDKSGLPLRIGHRGVSGHFPENSLQAFRAARPAGLDGVELDVHSTADGQLLVHHDPEIPGFGRIAELPAAQLASARLSNGEPVPTLGQALAALDGLKVWIEVKGLDPDFDPRLLDVVRGAGPSERYAVHAFDHRIVARLRRQADWLAGGILSASYPVDPVAELLAAGAVAYWMLWSLIDADLVQSIHSAGGQVIAWTVNDRRTAGALGALGVDGLCGNYPEHLDAR